MDHPEIIGIKASAGSGKTYQLSLRYLKLLSSFQKQSRENLSRIVAITFTNKAAAEMKERILLFLKEIALKTSHGGDLSEKTGIPPASAREWIDVIILNYSDFQVRTIDSLLFAILKSLSFELGIKSDSDVVFNMENVLEQGFDVLLTNLKKEKLLWDSAITTYLEIDAKDGFYPEPYLKKRLFKLYPKIDDGTKVPDMDVTKLKKLEEELKSAYEEFYSVYKELKTALNGSIFRNLSKDIELEKLIEKSFLEKDTPELFKKNKGSDENKEKLKNVLDSLKNKVKEYLDVMSTLKVGGYVSFLKRLKKSVDEICRREGIILGGDEWSKRVLDEMEKEGTPPLIYAHFASKFSHFLFDEFQDTSRIQWNGLYVLLEDVLSQGGSLFLVGDTKQAIFRWRGGDWSIFNEIFKTIYFPCVENKKTFVLDKNYRSYSHLVEFFNKLFEPLSNEDFVRDKIAPLCLGQKSPHKIYKEFAKEVSSAFSKHEQNPTKTEKKGKINIYQVEGNKEEIQAKVKEVFIREIKRVWDENSGKDSKIAVLVRSHVEAEDIASWLFELNIPVVTEKGLKLEVSGVVKGILSLLYYLYTKKEVFLYGFLASNLLKNGPLNEDRLLRGWIDGSFLNWEQEVDNICKKLRPYINRRSPYELLWEVMQTLSLFERLDSDLASHKPFVERLLEVSHDFEVKEGPSLAKYLEFWETGGLEERISLPENIDAVRILTIHKAKGLEFSVVFIPFTDWRIKNKAPIDKHNDQLVYLSSNLSEELQNVKYTLWAKEIQELLNLFYVAITRAEEELHLFVTCTKDKGLKPISHIVKQLIKEAGVEDLVKVVE